jgi:hypothetical protein
MAMYINWHNNTRFLPLLWQFRFIPIVSIGLWVKKYILSLARILHQDRSEYVEVLDVIKDNSDNVTTTDAFLVLFGEDMTLDHIIFYTNLYGTHQGKPFKPVIRMK